MIKRWYGNFKTMKLFQQLIYIDISLFFLVLTITLFILIGIKWTLGIYALVSVFALFIIWVNNRWWAKLFNANIFIFGVKGAGKDLLMQAGVYFNRKNRTYLSNMDYGYSSVKVDHIGEVMGLGQNTFRTLISGNVLQIPKNHELEGKGFLISDASIYFPSHEDTTLKKLYPSFPLFYAISRHLYNMPIVVNTQVNGRLWKSLREQVQDGYVQALKTYGKRDSWLWNSIPVLKNYLCVKLRYYEKEQSAVEGLLPFKKIAIVNRVSDKTVYMTTAGATQEQYEAKYGVIKEKFVIIKKSRIKYDDRHFHNLFFGYKSPTSRGDD